MIIDGQIKVKSDSPIKQFTSTGLQFEDGSVLEADVVIFATGWAFSLFLQKPLLTSFMYPRFGDAKKPIRDLCGEDVADRLNLKWGLDTVSVADSLTCTGS
jgi:hypothetical protein